MADRGPGRTERTRKARSSQAEEARPHTDCPYGCPLCIALGTLQQAGPETTEHLIRAGHELLLAFKALLDAASDQMGRAEAGRRSSGIEQIPVRR